ncbi:hypothetical protein DPMN_073957 [Dreissena polymorpha]|uniref:Uncharacterized protein n=1 Tax=Dreissena polymorpha TaxID=45954 RepID=A0A9D3YI90_DREPO|nr:hypothetical protein DPMN_073957 [Dreissena polymorpha]
MLDFLVIVWLTWRWLCVLVRSLFRQRCRQKIHRDRANLEVGQVNRQLCTVNNNALTGNASDSGKILEQRNVLRPSYRNEADGVRNEQHEKNSDIATVKQDYSDKKHTSPEKVKKKKRWDSSAGYFISQRLNEEKSERKSKSPSKERDSDVRGKKSAILEPKAAVTDLSLLKFAERKHAEDKSSHFKVDAPFSVNDQWSTACQLVASSETSTRYVEIKNEQISLKSNGHQLSPRHYRYTSKTTKNLEYSHNLDLTSDGQSEVRSLSQDLNAALPRSTESQNQTLWAPQLSSCTLEPNKLDLQLQSLNSAHPASLVCVKKAKFHSQRFSRKDECYETVEDDFTGLRSVETDKVNCDDACSKGYDYDGDNVDGDLSEMACRRSSSVDSGYSRRPFAPSYERIRVYERYLEGQTRDLISHLSERRRSPEYAGSRSRDEHHSLERLDPNNVFITKTSAKRSSRHSMCSMSDIGERRRNLSGGLELLHIHSDDYMKSVSESRLSLCEGLIRTKIRHHMSNIIGKSLDASDKDVLYTFHLDSPLHEDEHLGRDTEDRTLALNLPENDITLKVNVSEYDRTSNMNLSENDRLTENRAFDIEQNLSFNYSYSENAAHSEPCEISNSVKSVFEICSELDDASVSTQNNGILDGVIAADTGSYTDTNETMITDQTDVILSPEIIQKDTLKVIDGSNIGTELRNSLKATDYHVRANFNANDSQCVCNTEDGLGLSEFVFNLGLFDFSCIKNIHADDDRNAMSDSAHKDLQTKVCYA